MGVSVDSVGACSRFGLWRFFTAVIVLCSDGSRPADSGVWPFFQIRPLGLEQIDKDTDLAHWRSARRCVRLKRLVSETATYDPERDPVSQHRQFGNLRAGWTEADNLGRELHRIERQESFEMVSLNPSFESFAWSFCNLDLFNLNRFGSFHVVGVSRIRIDQTATFEKELPSLVTSSRLIGNENKTVSCF